MTRQRADVSNEPDVMVRVARCRATRENVKVTLLAIAFVIGVGAQARSTYRMETLARERITVAKDIRTQQGDITEALDRLNRLVAFTQRIDSPEARAAQQAQLQALVAQIGCENREVVQEVITGFERAGLIDTGSIIVTCGQR